MGETKAVQTALPPPHGEPLRTTRMLDESTESRRRARITTESGFHLRLASRFIQMAQSFQAEITIQYGGHCYDGKSILSLLGMGAECGSHIELVARGSDARKAAERLAALLAIDCGRDDATP